MRIVVPYAGRRHPRTVAAGRATTAQTGVPVVWEDVSGDEFAYWRLMARLWEPSDDLVIVEHDVELRADVIEQFNTCERLWCTHGYDNICHPECMEAWSNALGCTRFRKELIAACPDAVLSIPDEWHKIPSYSAKVHRRDWHNLCDELAGDKIGGAGVPGSPRTGSVRDAGFTHHFHNPPVVHWDRNRDPEFWYGEGGRYHRPVDVPIENPAEYLAGMLEGIV